MTSTNTTPESQECPESTLDTFNRQQKKPRTKKCSCGVYALSNCSKNCDSCKKVFEQGSYKRKRSSQQGKSKKKCIDCGKQSTSNNQRYCKGCDAPFPRKKQKKSHDTPPTLERGSSMNLFTAPILDSSSVVSNPTLERGSSMNLFTAPILERKNSFEQLEVDKFFDYDGLFEGIVVEDAQNTQDQNWNNYYSDNLVVLEETSVFN